jgi:hypothetical protein
VNIDNDTEIRRLIAIRTVKMLKEKGIEYHKHNGNKKKLKSDRLNRQLKKSQELEKKSKQEDDIPQIQQTGDDQSSEEYWQQLEQSEENSFKELEDLERKLSDALYLTGSSTESFTLTSSQSKEMLIQEMEQQSTPQIRPVSLLRSSRSR